MLRTNLHAIVACCLIEIAGAGAFADGLQIDVMSFNVRWDGLDTGANAWVNRRPVAIQTIETCAPDVIGLQEPSPAQTRDLDAALENYLSFTGKHERDQHVPFLFRSGRFRLAEGGSFWLVENSDLSGGTRRCVWIRLIEKNTNRAFYVFNNHFDHRSGESRLQSARALRHAIRNREHGDPFIVLGDFNEEENGPAIKLLRGDVPSSDGGFPSDGPAIALVDTFRRIHPAEPNAASAHGFRGTTTGPRIDFIFVRPENKILDAQIVRFNVDGLYPSDHYPVSASLRLMPGEKTAAGDR